MKIEPAEVPGVEPTAAAAVPPGSSPAAPTPPLDSTPTVIDPVAFAFILGLLVLAILLMLTMVRH